MYFSNINTIDELKKTYRQLAFKHHPDRGGDTEIMKAINAEYESLFKKLNINNGSGESKYNLDDGFREMINKIINLEGLEIEICGLWVWVSGNTKEHKSELKEAGFYWASKKLMWYWRPEEGKIRRSSGIKDMDYIRNVYGSETVKTGDNKASKKRITA